MISTGRVLEATYRKVILPLGKYSADANTPGRTVTDPVQRERGMPGVREGQ